MGWLMQAFNGNHALFHIFKIFLNGIHCLFFDPHQERVILAITLICCDHGRQSEARVGIHWKHGWVRPCSIPLSNLKNLVCKCPCYPTHEEAQDFHF
jgi:hypothetical protein